MKFSVGLKSIKDFQRVFWTPISSNMKPMVYIRDTTEKATLTQNPVSIKTTLLWKAILRQHI